MTDVRLTALNPEDSKVYPVACNASGELLVDKGEPEGPDLNVEGELSVGGSANFAAQVIVDRGLANTSNSASIVVSNTQDNNAARINNDGSSSFGGGAAIIANTGKIEVKRNDNNNPVSNANPSFVVKNSETNADAVWIATNYFRIGGSVASSPNIELHADGTAEFMGDVVIGSRGTQWLIRESNGVAMLIEQSFREAKEQLLEEVRDLPRELDLVEAALNEIMSKLKMTPPSGWPVWDGSDNLSES